MPDDDAFVVLVFEVFVVSFFAAFTLLIALP